MLQGSNACLVSVMIGGVGMEKDSARARRGVIFLGSRIGATEGNIISILDHSASIH